MEPGILFNGSTMQWNNETRYPSMMPPASLSNLNGQVSIPVEMEPRRTLNIDLLANAYMSNYINQFNQANTIPLLGIEEQGVALFGGINSGSYESDLNQVESRGNREGATEPGEEKEEKCCNCKKRKCMSGYCKCYNGKSYCLDSCECESCSNKPQFHDKFKENSLLVDLKVNKSPQIHQETGERHRKGCNCKKSKCKNGHCDCFQDGFGCGDGCQCDDCKNPLGAKKGNKQHLTKGLDMPSYQTHNSSSSNSNFTFNQLRQYQDANLQRSSNMLPVHVSRNAYQYSQPLTIQNDNPVSIWHEPISPHINQMVQAEHLQRLPMPSPRECYFATSKTFVDSPLNTVPMPQVNQTNAPKRFGDNLVNNAPHQAVQSGHYPQPQQRRLMESENLHYQMHTLQRSINHLVNSAPINITHQDAQIGHNYQMHTSERSIDYLINSTPIDITHQDVQTGNSTRQKALSQSLKPGDTINGFIEHAKDEDPDSIFGAHQDVQIGHNYQTHTLERSIDFTHQDVQTGNSTRQDALSQSLKPGDIVNGFTENAKDEDLDSIFEDILPKPIEDLSRFNV